MAGNHKIILFDGVCNLCNGSVNFVIEHDKKKIFKFAALQSEIGRKMLAERGINTVETDSILLIEPGAYYIKSTAALRIAKNLSGLWPLLYGFVVLPLSFRDWVYGIVAKNRYRWFGKRDSCMIPTAEVKGRFL